MIETNFKHTDIGLIPHDWEVVELGKIGEPLMCKRVLKEQTALVGDVPFYKIGTFGQKADAYISRQLYEELKSKYNFPQKGDILISAAGTIGRTVEYDGKDAYYQDSNIVWLDNDESLVTNQYLKLWLKIIKWETTDGGTIQRLYNRNIEESKIAAPPTIGEQVRIAEALSDIDTLIQDLKKLIEKKQYIQRATMQQLLSANIQLKGFNKPWRETEFWKIFTFYPTNTYSREFLKDRGEVFNIHYGDVLIKYGSIVDFTKADIPFLNSEITRYSKKALLQDGDIIIADTAEDETVGKSIEVFNLKDKKAVSGLHTMLCRPNSGLFASKYLGYFMNSDYYHKQLLPKIVGTKVSSISKTAIFDTKILFPTDIAEQQAIAKVLTDMDEEIQSLKQRLQKYQDLRSGMMQQLLTGKIRLL